MILISGIYNSAASIVRQARSKGLKAIFLGGDGLKDDALIKNAADAAEGLVLTSPFSIEATSEKAVAFRKAYNDKFGREPGTWAAQVYDAVMQGAEAIRKGGPDRATRPSRPCSPRRRRPNGRARRD